MRNKMLKLMLSSLFLLLTFLPACVTSALSENDHVTIYAAVVRQLYTVDHTFGSKPPNWPVIYLLRATDDRAGDRRETEARSSLLPKSMQEAIVAAVDDLPAEFIWIDDWHEVVDKSTLRVKDNGALITLGNIYLQKVGTVQVAASIYFAGAGAAGMTYIVEQVDGIWKITGYTGRRWIS